MVKNKNNVFSCKNQKLDLKIKFKSIDFSKKIFFLILFDIITPLPS
jgi:hypothetical protein